MNTPTMTNHRITILRSIASTVCLTTALLASPASAAVVAPVHPGQTDVCQLDAKFLPRTPDAVEGWLRGCPAR